MAQKWRLYECNFSGAGEYSYGDDKLTVDEHGVFEFEGDNSVPLHGIAARVGGKRDRSYAPKRVRVGIGTKLRRWLRWWSP